MKKDESLNQKVASFEHLARKYEIDYLKDASLGDYSYYDIFDVTEKQTVVGQVITESPEILTEELIELAKREIDKDYAYGSI